MNANSPGVAPPPLATPGPSPAVAPLTVPLRDQIPPSGVTGEGHPGGGHRPRLLELCCGAGGTGTGFHRAGFDVIGVDLADQPNYPFPFFREDAVRVLDHLVRHWAGKPEAHTLGFRIDAIAVAPPCQGYSGMTACRPGLAGEYPQLIGVVRQRLGQLGIPWVIENVAGSGLPAQGDLFGAHGVMLCGSMFGLELYRHRLFETSFPVAAPHHPRHLVPASKAGHWEPGTSISAPGNCAPTETARH